MKGEKSPKIPFLLPEIYAAILENGAQNQSFSKYIRKGNTYQKNEDDESCSL
jgi:hypothetical protein